MVDLATFQLTLTAYSLPKQQYVFMHLYRLKFWHHHMMQWLITISYKQIFWHHVDIWLSFFAHAPKQHNFYLQCKICYNDHFLHMGWNFVQLTVLDILGHIFTIHHRSGYLLSSSQNSDTTVWFHNPWQSKMLPFVFSTFLDLPWKMDKI